MLDVVLEPVLSGWNAVEEDEVVLALELLDDDTRLPGQCPQ